jgi:hypothetical protein
MKIQPKNSGGGSPVCFGLGCCAAQMKSAPHASVDQREKGKERSQTGDDVMKDRQ